MKVTGKVLDNFLKVEREGLSPPCFICGKHNCYEMIIVEGDDRDFLVRNYFREEDGYLCVDCRNWMIRVGSPITKILHTLLKIKNFFNE